MTEPLDAVHPTRRAQKADDVSSVGRSRCAEEEDEDHVRAEAQRS